MQMILNDLELFNIDFCQFRGALRHFTPSA